MTRYNKQSRRLTAELIAAIRAPGWHHDGDGLYLEVTQQPSGLTHCWVFRYRISGIDRRMGLGAYPAVSISNARKLMGEARADLQRGIDPVWAREANRMTAAARAQQETADRIETFGHVADEWLAIQEVQWSDDHRRQVESKLTRFCAPIWNKPIRHLLEPDIRTVLDPIWKAKRETASRLRAAIEGVFATAIATKRHLGPNPARWEENLEAVFVAPSKLDVEHFTAVPFEQIPMFAAELRATPGAAARALEFTLLTAIRSGKVRDARFDELTDKGTWKPSFTGKLKRSMEHPFETPLCPRALAIIKEMRQARVGDYIFGGRSAGGRIGVNEMSRVMECIAPGYDVHGLRSSFRDWLGELTDYPRDLAEYAMQHKVGNAVEAAYRHGTGFAKRRKLMNDWAAYVCTPPAAADGKVVPISAKAAR